MPQSGANKQCLRAAPGSNGLLRVAVAQSWRWASPRVLPENAMVVPLSPPLPLALVLRTSNNTTLSHEGARNKRFHRTAAGSNGLLRAAGSGKAAAARSSSS